MFAGAGRIVLTLLTLPYWVVFVVLWGTSAAHYFMVVLEQTSAGGDRIHWPDDRFLDRLWKVFYLAILLAIWLAPVVLIFQSLDLGDVDPVLLAAPVMLVILWLVVPVSFLSALSSTSGFAILRLLVLRRLIRCWRRWLTFYGLTAGMLVAAGGLIHFAVVGWEELRGPARFSGMSDVFELWSWLFVLPATGLVLGVLVLFYARLLGRLAWIMNQVEEEPDDTMAAEKESKGEDQATQPQPDALEPPKPLAAPETAPALETYALVVETPPGKPNGDEPVEPQPLPDFMERPEDLREKILPALLVRKVVFFPWYRSNWIALAWLTVFGLALCVLARLQVG